MIIISMHLRGFSFQWKPMFKTIKKHTTCTTTFLRLEPLIRLYSWSVPKHIKVKVTLFQMDVFNAV